MTNRVLLERINALPMPCSLRQGLFGLTYGERGKLASTAADEWTAPSRAILAGLLTECPHLQLPSRFPTTAEFASALGETEPFMNRLSVRLGKEQTFVSRAIRQQDKPGAAVWAVMAAVTRFWTHKSASTGGLRRA